MNWVVGILSLALCMQSIYALPQGSINSHAPEISNSLPTATLPITTFFTSSVPLVQSTSTDAVPDITGTIHTSLETSGRESSAPFGTSSVFSPSSSIPIPSAETLRPSSQPAQVLVRGNVFAPIATGAPPPQIPLRADFPDAARGVGIKSHQGPLHTNKFYANLFLTNQSHPVWTHPYSVSWAKGTGSASDIWGLSISHINREFIVFGPEGTVPPEFYINPLGVQSIVLSAAELGETTVLTTDTHQAFSVNANLLAHAGGTPLISCPLVQGMGFVTAIYKSASVVLRSSVFFKEVVYVGNLTENTSFKYRIKLFDDTTWLLYITPNVAQASGIPAFTIIDSTEIKGPALFQGTIQVAKNPAGNDGDIIYDSAAGAYPVSALVSASTSGETGTYSISWNRAGIAKQMLLMFALPHHMESMIADVAARATPIQLATTSKGMATGVLSNTFVFFEPTLPVDIGFEPWSPRRGTIHAVSTRAAVAVNSAAGLELAQNMTYYTDLDSMYYSGKALSKYATAIYAVNDLGTDSGVAVAGLRKLQQQFARFVNNQQQFPLAYDTAWGGLVSTAGYSGDVNRDFGNTLYNDHHFHYGYFVHAAAVIAYLDPSWLGQGTNKAWVESLIRDYANPVADDPYFPFSRSFDWFHGHSWARGLFDSADGKDEESTSEDAFSLYAMKMWGAVTGDTAMEERSNLQLAILARSLKNYFYMTVDNTVQPKEFIPNVVPGILFENKLDHTTYFGSNTSFIEGIHMLPINPSSAYTRTQDFVSQEWAHYFANGYLDTVEGGWKGILYANLAIIDPERSFEFFSNPAFDWSWLDDGASRTWYLAYAAGMGGG